MPLGDFDYQSSWHGSVPRDSAFKTGLNFLQSSRRITLPGPLDVDNLSSLRITGKTLKSKEMLESFGFKRVVEYSLAVLKVHSNNKQGDHLSGKRGNVKEFDSCQENVRDFTKVRDMSGNFQGKNLVREKLPKTVQCKLHICVHTGV